MRELGIVRGTIVAAWRVIRCNPFSHGGVDELADRSLFRDHEGHRHDHSARRPHDDPRRHCVIFQPFVDLAEAIIKFFDENVGLSLGPVRSSR